MQNPAHREYSDLPEVSHAHGQAEVSHVHGQAAPQVVLESDYPEVTPASFTLDKYPVEPFRDHSASTLFIDESHEPEKRRVCGLRRPLFITIAVLSTLLVIGAVIGLAIGLSTRANKDETPPPDPDETLPPNSSPTGGVPGVESNLFANSSLATANWTDPSGYVHLYVFYQNTDKELLTSVWDSENSTWATHSISRSLVSSSGRSVNLRFGTPIAAFSYTNPSFQIRVYALTGENSVRELLTPDPSLASGWQHGQLGRDAFINTGVGINSGWESKLAALRPQCGTGADCQANFPELAIAYQDNFGIIHLAKAPDWEPQAIGPAADGSVIGLSSVMRGPSITDVEWRLTYDEGGTLREFTSDAQLTNWTRGLSLGTVTTRQTDANLAAFSYDLTDMMAVSVQLDGELITARIWDSQTWAVNKTPDLGSAPRRLKNSAFSAIAGNPQKRIYGIVDGVIHEWEFSTILPLQWRYIGTVSTSFEKEGAS